MEDFFVENAHLSFFYLEPLGLQLTNLLPSWTKMILIGCRFEQRRDNNIAVELTQPKNC